MAWRSPYPIDVAPNQSEKSVWSRSVMGKSVATVCARFSWGTLMSRGSGCVVKRNKTVREVMTPDPLAVVDASMSIDEAGRLMQAWDVDEVLVTDGDRLCGVLTGQEVVVRSMTSGRHPATISAGECCDHDVQTVDPDVPTERAAEIMRRQKRPWLPVTRADQLVGTVWFTTAVGASR